MYCIQDESVPLYPRLFYNFSISTERNLEIVFDSGRKTNNFRIVKGSFFKFFLFFYSRGFQWKMPFGSMGGDREKTFQKIRI
jgi:hypothetical protein